MVEKVLLIEDDQNFAKLLMRWLQSDGSREVISIADGSLASQLVRAEHWDLVISDVNLPGMDGIELVRHYKAHAPQTPVLLMTAHESVNCVIRALQNCADDFLIKPFTRELLLLKVKDLISKAASNLSQKQVSPHKNVLAIGAYPDDVEQKRVT